MDILPIFLGLAAAVLWGVSEFLATPPSREIDQYRTTAYTMLFSALTILPVAIFIGIKSNIDSRILALAFISSIFLFFAFLLEDKSFRYGELEINAPIIASYPVVVVLGSIFVLGDVLSLTKLFYIALMIIGIILASVRFSALKSKNGLLTPGVPSAILSMILFGIVGIFSGAYVTVIGFALLAFIWRGASSIMGFISMRIKHDGIKVPKKPHIWAYLIGSGVTDGLAIMLATFAVYISTKDLSIIYTLTALSGVFAMLIGFGLFKEKMEKNQWFGIALATLGVILISLLA